MRDGQSFEIRATSARFKNSSGVLSVPAAMRRVTPPGARFVPEWHPDGILYRYVGTAEVADEDPPSWTLNGGSNE